MITRQTLFTGWNFLRWLRLIMAISLAIQSIQTQHILPGIVAALLLFQAITNVGCCIGDSCSSVPSPKNNRQDPDDTTFEEIKHKEFEDTL
jgi:hypothetical protein